MTADSLEDQCCKFVKEYKQFHLIRNEIPVPVNILMSIFKESKLQNPTSDFKKRFQELKRILEEIKHFFQLCYSEGKVSERMSCQQSAMMSWRKLPRKALE